MNIQENGRMTKEKEREWQLIKMAVNLKKPDKKVF